MEGERDGGDGRSGVTACHLNLGNTLTELGRYAEGIEHTRRAPESARGNRVIECMSLGDLAEAYLFSGDLAAADQHASAARTLLLHMGATDGLVDVLLTETRIKIATGRGDEARASAARPSGSWVLRPTGGGSRSTRRWPADRPVL